MKNQVENFRKRMMVTVATDPEVTAELESAVRSRAWLQQAVHAETYCSASCRPSFGPQIREMEACIIFIDFDESVERAVTTTRYFVETYPGKVTVIAVAKESTPTLILTAMRAGCSEFLSGPVHQCSLDAVLGRLEKSQTELSSPGAQRGTIIALLGAKGGVGSTTMAVHLAASLARRHGKRTLLIDQHAVLGHVCVYLGVDGSHYNVGEVVRNLARMDSELLQRFVARHSSGVEVLSSPDVSAGHLQTQEETPLGDADSVGRTLEFLRGEYDYIVVDCDRTHFALNHAVFAACNYVYLVASPEVAAIRDLARYMDELVLVEEAADKVRVLINRFDSPYALPIEQIERAIKLPVAVKVPNSYSDMVRAANLGEPLLPDSNTPIAATLARWSDELAGAPQKVPQRKERRLLPLWKQAAAAH